MRKSRFSDRASARRRAKRRRRGLFKACRANRARRFARGGAHRSGSVRGDDGRHGALRRLRHRRSRRPRCSRYTNPTSAWSPSTAPRVHPANGGPSRPRRARSPGAMRAACGGRSGDVDLCAVRVQPVDGLGLVAVQLPGAHVMAVRPGNVDQLAARRRRGADSRLDVPPRHFNGGLGEAAESEPSVKPGGDVVHHQHALERSTRLVEMNDLGGPEFVSEPKCVIHRVHLPISSLDLF